MEISLLGGSAKISLLGGRPSLLPALLASLLACFLACFLASFLASFLPSLLASLLASFLASFLPYFLPRLLACSRTQAHTVKKPFKNLAHGPKMVDLYNCKKNEIMFGGILSNGHGFPIRLPTSRYDLAPPLVLIIPTYQ